MLEAYREDRLGAPQAAEILGFSRLQWNHFLKEKQEMEHAYSVEDLERDVAAIQRLRFEPRRENLWVTARVSDPLLRGNAGTFCR